MHDFFHLYLPIFLLFVLLTLAGLLFHDLLWFPATLLGALLGLGLCVLFIKLLEKLTHRRLLR